MVGDYREALKYHRRAENMLRVVRKHHVKGETAADIDDALSALEGSVENLRAILAEERRVAEEGAEETSEEDVEPIDSAYHSDE
jgi:arginine/ornithine N-succinyltransferase beta subunit